MGIVLVPMSVPVVRVGLELAVMKVYAYTHSVIHC